jgi:NAD(P)-dependent dehydrogenase (short-subunit alcohol dehydrogenase family)
MEKCVSKYGRIDVLVNNVGLSAPGTAVQMDEPVWDKQVDVNLKSVYLCCKSALAVMEKQESGGAVVNVSSIAGIRHIGNEHVAYAAAKAAVIQFTKNTAVAFAPKNIRLNTVIPGLMNTPLVRGRLLGHSGAKFEDLVAHRDKQVSMGKMGEAWDVGYAVLFLASAEAKYITGTELVVDGGITASTGMAR